MSYAELVSAQRLDRCPSLKAFRNSLPVGLIAANADLHSFLVHFQELLSSPFDKELIDYELVKIAEDKQYFPPNSNEVELNVLKTPWASLSLKLIPPNFTFSRALHSYNEHVFIGVLTEEGAVVETYQQSLPYDNARLDPTRPLIRNGHGTIFRTKPLVFRAALEVFRMLPAPNPVLFVLLSIRTPLRFRWSYNRENLLPERLVAADAAASRLGFACSLLAEIGDSSSIAPLHSLLQHPDHLVRWAAINATMSIDPVEGLSLFKTALNDPHPDVRCSAARAIATAARDYS